MEINHKEFGKVILRCNERKIPLDIKGATGIGKSWVVKEKAKEIAKKSEKKFIEWNELSAENKRALLKPDLISKAYIFVDIRLSQMDPSDLRGLPNLQGNTVEWKPNLIWKVLSNPQAEGIVFFDEMNLSTPSIQASSYQIINDYQIGELAISKGIFMVSAGNRLSDRANVFDEPAPLKNRRINVTLKEPFMDEKSSDDWGKWGSSNGILPSIIAFLYWKPSYLYRFDEKNKDPSFPTPRMWHKTSKLIEGINDLKEVRILLGGAVGEGIAKEFIAFQKLKQTINLKDLLKHPEKAAEIKELDIKYSVVSGISELYKSDPKILNEMIGVGIHMEPEFSMFMLRIAKGFSQSNFATQLRNAPNWMKISNEYAKYLM